MRKQNVYFWIIIVVMGSFYSSCDKCRHGEYTQNSDITANVKNTVFKFPDGTLWIFKNNFGDFDSVMLGPASYSYDGGACEDKDCCVKIFSQHATQNMNYISVPDSLIKFQKFYFPDHILETTAGVKFDFSTLLQFNTNYEAQLVVNGDTLLDVQGYSDIEEMSNTKPVAAFWSLSKGLVRYDYDRPDGSTVIYERQNF